MSGLPPASTSAFGMCVGDRPQPLAAAGRQQHRLHASSSSSRRQRRQFPVAPCNQQRVGDEARGIGKVLGLAVAVVDAREDAEHLEMALQPHPLEGAPELGEVRRHRKPGAPGLFPIARRAVEHALLVPADERVAHQRNHVVGDRPEHRVLEVEHAGVGLAHHQVARHVIAMHVDHRLRQRALHQQLEDVFQAFRLVPAKAPFADACPHTTRETGSSPGAAAPRHTAAARRGAWRAASAAAHRWHRRIAERRCFRSTHRGRCACQDP